MKILVRGIIGNHVHGFQNLFEKAGHKWIWWEENHTPAFDAFDEIRPDIFIGCGSNTTAIDKCLASYRNVRTMMQIAPYTFEINGTKLAYPTLVDQYVHRVGPINKRLSCDIACVELPHPHLLHICTESKLIVKISGHSPWPIPQYIGVMTGPEMVSLYQSAKAVYANTPEEAGRAIACGSLCITSSKRLCELFKNNVAILDSDFNWTSIPNGNARKFLYDNELTYAKAFESVRLLFAQQGIKL